MDDYVSGDEAGAAWMAREAETAEPWVPEPPDEPRRSWSCFDDGCVFIFGVAECVECGEPWPGDDDPAAE